MKLTHGSLFSGVGGFDMGADNAGLETLWQCEIDSKPRSVLKKHWPKVKQYIDVKDVKGNEVKPVDVISFGSPCQDLSIAGKRKGLEGERSGLFHQAMRIVKEMQDATEGQYPRFIIWENVRGALSSSEGKDFEKVIEEMGKLGAVDVSWRILNAANFGPPQRRLRVFVIADLRGRCAREILSQQPRLLWHPPKSAKKRKGTTRKTKASSGETKQVANTIPAELYHKNSVTNQDVNSEHLIVDESIYFKPHLQDGMVMQPDNAKAFDEYNNTVSDVHHTLRSGTKQSTGAIVPETTDSIYAVDFYNASISNVSQTIKSHSPNDINIGGVLTVSDVVPEETTVYVKSKRPMNKDDYETWVENKPAPTLNTLDNTGDGRETVIAITERAGKPGGGKGILLTEELSPTLNTAIPQQIAYPIQDGRDINKKQNGLGIGNENDPSYTIDSTGAQSVATNYKVRRLTPKECERLMGWPDDHTKYDSDGNELSDSARYKMCGNGISTPVAQWICENLIKAVKKEQAT